ncbi:unnamed protein product [Symbiodinium sp. CCMP2592]|nr:unnamed protein product [Symbiodinium sp. CCMP2592]
MRPIPEQPLSDCHQLVLEIFQGVLPEGDTVVGKSFIRQVLAEVGVPEDEADTMLALVNTGYDKVCYQEFFQFMFQEQDAIVRPPRKRLSKQVEEPFLCSYFRRVFETLGGANDGGLNKAQLKEALEAFEMSLPGSANTQIEDVVAHIFEEIDQNGDSEICWNDFQKWLLSWNVPHDDSEDAARSLFTFLDRDGSGHISAQEMMDALMLMSEFESKTDRSLSVTHSEAGQIIRDLDPDGEGGIDYHTFLEVLHAARNHTPGSMNQQPHLVLNFDVNNTVVMLDSATGADSEGLISMVLSNSAWGTIDYDDNGWPIRWTLKAPELSPTQPEADLHTYSEFVVLQNPFPDSAAFGSKADLRAANEKVKASRRKALWSFAHSGMPGEAFRKDLASMQEKLLLPEAVRGTQAAKDAGLGGESVQLLPSFLHLLRELKRRGRSFTLIFRTFGKDLPQLRQELEALCQGWHPLFQKEDLVVLDGSDGQPDYRMKFDKLDGCGTFFRNPLEGDFIALAMGTVEQPSKLEEGPQFWKDKEHVQIFEGVHQVFKHYMQISSQCHTVALRDYYPGWAAANSTSAGGKPFFLGRLDPAEHCMFFDDHISPLDPKIVDPIDAHLWPRRYSSGQVYGVHLVQAQPLLSIRDRNYFVKCVEDCEAARAAKLERWHKLKRLVGDLDGVRKVLAGFIYTSVPSQRVVFRPWSSSRDVHRAQRVPTFEDE